MAKITYTDKAIGSKWKAIDANEVKESVNDLYDAVADKVDKVTGKQLSTEDFTTAEKTKLDSGVIFNQDDEIQEAKFSISDSGHIGGHGVTETFVSPTITGHQGYATDGTYHYIFDTAQIDKRNNDGSWSVALSNSTPFAGVSGGVNHLGDGSYYNGSLYVPCENLVSGSDVSAQKILVFDAATLALMNQFDISAQDVEVSALAIDGPNNIIYTASHFDGTRLWRYNATTGAFLGTTILPAIEPVIKQIQGISCYGGFIYIASEQNGIVKYDVANNKLIFVDAPNVDRAIPEGLDVVSGQIRLLVDSTGTGSNSNVYYLDPTTTPQGFYTDQSGTSYFGSSLKVGNKLSVRTETAIAGFNLGSSQDWPLMYLEARGNTIASVTHDLSNTALMRNAYYQEGWVRPDATKDAFGVFQNNRIEFRTSAAASDLTWTTPMFLNTSGDLNIVNATASRGLNVTVNGAANDQALLIKNTNSTGGSGCSFVDNGGNRFMRVGVVNTASTLGAAFGLAGEGYVSSSTSATGLHLCAVTGPIRFSSNSVEKARFAATTGNLLIGTTTDISSAKLVVTSTTQGFLPPRMTTTERNAIVSPVAGLVIYNTTTNKLNVYTTVWEAVTSA